LALVLVVLVVVERTVARPVYELARLMRRAESGDFLVRARVTANDEIGALSMAFNRMLRSITTLKADEVDRERRLQLAQAELTMQAELATTNAALKRRVLAQEVLMEAAHRIGSTLDRKTLLERLRRLLRDKLNMPHFALYLVDDVVDGEHHQPMLVGAEFSGLLDVEQIRNQTLRIGAGVAGAVAETGAPLSIRDLADPWANVSMPPAGGKTLRATGSAAAVPMLHQGRVVGVLEFHAEETNSFDDDDMRLLQALGALAAVAIVNADLYQATLELSVTDALTKVMNRRALNRMLEAEVTRAQRFSTQLAVLMIDCDHFKQYNDRMGHLLGDEALKELAQTLQASVRKVDAVARFGGEEFCVVLPRADDEAAEEVADKLLKAVRAITLPGVTTQPLGRLSISIGVAVYPADMPTAYVDDPAVALLAVADKAAFMAKNRGRDQVVASREWRPQKPPLS
jgi:diguanylate cyclase (GGDEF)-like protein